jgi:predicted DNA binding protein
MSDPYAGLREHVAQGITEAVVEKQHRATGAEHGSHTKPETIVHGEKHGNAKLTDQQVVEIRKAYAAGEYSLRDLSVMFGVSVSHVHRLVRNEARR